MPRLRDGCHPERVIVAASTPEHEVFAMGLLSWIVLGLIAGAIASFLVGGGLGLIEMIVLGIIGAVVGGFLAQQLGYGSVSGLDLTSIIIATIGAIVVIVVVRALRGGRRTAL
jgi:uncharacterized membrane protein YeaQ/YmgE (transglycosylase-associated protein family)